MSEKSSTLGKVISLTGESVLALLLSTTLLLACAQIFMRTVTGGSLLWIDPLLRYLVLWSGLFGAVMATFKNKHIALDIASFILPDSSKNIVELIVLFFATLTAITLTWAATSFILSEIEYGGLGLFNLPTYIWNLVFPVTFAVMSVTYFFQSIQCSIRLFSKQQTKVEG